MIISPGRKYIFVHAPKTGGTSMSVALERRAMADDILIGDTPKAKRRAGRVAKLQAAAAGRLWKHSTIADIEGIVDFSGMFVFTLVRNPWDRLVSYYHWLKDQSWDHPAVHAAQEQSFADFLGNAVVMDPFRSMPFQAYVTNRAGTQRCDAFIRLEALDEDSAALEAHLGFSLGDVPRLNNSARGPYRDYYDRRTRELVAENCAADIARFGYVF